MAICVCGNIATPSYAMHRLCGAVPADIAQEEGGPFARSSLRGLRPADIAKSRGAVRRRYPPRSRPCTGSVLKHRLGMGYIGWPGLLAMTTVAGLQMCWLAVLCCRVAGLLLACCWIAGCAAGQMSGRDRHCHTTTMIPRTGERRAAGLLLALLAAGSAGCRLLVAGGVAGHRSA